LAGLLQIETSMIKVVSVYAGSLVVNYEIEAASEDSLKTVESKQVNLFATN